MAIKQNMDKPIFSANNGRVFAIADEANDGIKAVPAELVVKAADDSTFSQISESNPLPVKGDFGFNVDPENPMPVTGNVQLTGSKLREQLTEADAVSGVLTFADNINIIEIYNTDAANAGVFTVNGLAITVPADTPFKAAIGGTPSPTVTVTGATTYIVSRYE